MISLKHLKHFVKYEHFKMENIHVLRVFEKDDYLVKMDLKDAYFHNPHLGKPPKVSEVFFGRRNLYEFACLPFGLASAPRIFTKIMKPLTGLLRQLLTRVEIYPDDMLITAETHELANCHAATTVNLLESLGFTIIPPSTAIEFLGFLVDSKTLT